jgi:hypothetical protein
VEVVVTEQEIRQGLQVDPFRTHVSTAQNEWVVRWFTTSEDFPEQVAQATFRETHEGIEWLRFYVAETFRRQGIYTQALRWSMALGVEVVASPVATSGDDWDGFKAARDGMLRLDKRVAKARVKVG